MRRILVDNAGSWNIGDISMVESGVAKFLNLCPEAELHVVDRSNEQSAVWNFPRVHRTPNIEIAPRQRRVLRALSRLPLLWRLPSIYQAQALQRMFSDIGRESRASDLPVSIASPRIKSTTLGTFCENYDALYLVGGGNITDTFPFELLRKCAWINCFSEQGKPVILTGQQIGPFHSQTTRDAAMRGLLKCCFVGVREPLDSLHYCQHAGLAPDRFALMGDDSFGLRKPEKGDIARLLHKYGVGSGEFIALNLRSTSYMKATRRRLPAIAKFVQNLIRELKLPVLVVPIVLSGTESDILCGKQLAAMVGSESVRVMDTEGLTPSTARGVLGCAVGGVGTSYHFCTFALSEAVPVVCLHDGSYYNQKANGIAAFWGDKRFAMSLSEIQDPAAIGRIRDVFNDRQLRIDLALRAKEAHRVWHENFRTAMSVIDIRNATEEISTAKTVSGWE